MTDRPSDPYGDQYDLRTFVRRVLSVLDPGMRKRQVRRHFTTVDADVVAAHLQGIIRANARGGSSAAEVLLSVSEFLIHADADDLLAIENVNLSARRDDHIGVSWLLLDPPPHRRADGLRGLQIKGRAYPLGTRRAMAAGWHPQRLEQLLHDNDPMVIDKLCSNPRIHEQHILTIVTRRPTRPAILQAVASTPRWLRSVRIRYAMAHNPYIRTGLALRMLPLLPVDMLHRLRFASDLHPAIALATSYMIDLREADVDEPTPRELDRLHS